MKLGMPWMTRGLVWLGPALVLLIAVVVGFGAWTINTQAGARWLLVTVMRQIDGDITGVQGSILEGLHIQHLSLALPNLALQASAVQLQIDWQGLWERRLHVHHLSAQTLTLAAKTGDSAAGASVDMPLSLRLDQLSLGRLDVRIDDNAVVLGANAVNVQAEIIDLAHWQVHRLMSERIDVRVNGVEPVAAINTVDVRAEMTPQGGQLRIAQLALAHALGDLILQGDVRWQGEAFHMQALSLQAQWLDGSYWNDLPVTGTVQVQAQRMQANATAWPLYAWTLPHLALDMSLGQNRLVFDGAYGQAADRLTLQVQIPVLAQIWPQWGGEVHMQGCLSGSVQQHMAELDIAFTPPDDALTVLDTAPLHMAFALSGRWEHLGSQKASWHATITRLQTQYADIQLESLADVEMTWQSLPWQWRIGAVPLRVMLAQQTLVTLVHQQSTLGRKTWQTQGDIAQWHVNDAQIARVRKRLNLDHVFPQAQSAVQQVGNDMLVSLDWNLRFTDALEGTLNLRRIVGDLAIPWDVPVSLGLRELRMRLEASRIASGRSQLRGAVKIDTQDMGVLTLDAQTQLGSDWQLQSAGNTQIALQSHMADLAWSSFFMTLPLELGGALDTRLTVQHRADGNWVTQGRVTGQGLRMLYLDEGVRLVDGTLAARFDDEQFVLESLRFPARVRVEPKERRTRQWITTDPDAQEGSLTVRGAWNLRDHAGGVALVLQRYPLLQRIDRHAMFSGDVYVNLSNEAQAMQITGNLTADAGWADLDIISNVPSLDSDVVVKRASVGEKPIAAGLVSSTALDMQIDLGERFYLTGYGLDSGLAGQLRLRMQDGRLRGEGALNTRSGTIDAYGQRLRLLRGSLTFQGDVTSPVLDIVAMRPGDLAVQAGVRVAGTARRPRIDLISVPDVNDVEKLSWLLLGRGSEQAGGEAALLLSVGSSFFTAGEPFYRQFGLDELSLRSGTVGATGSVLPVESVVRNLDASVSNIESQFVVASKNISQNFTLGVEQALSDTSTVGRISYSLARGLNASLSIGAVNGLALVYRWFSRGDR